MSNVLATKSSGKIEWCPEITIVYGMETTLQSKHDNSVWLLGGITGFLLKNVKGRSQTLSNTIPIASNKTTHSHITNILNDEGK